MSRAQRLPACQCESGDLVQLHNGTLLCNPNRSLLDGGLRESTKRIYTRGHPADACELGQKKWWDPIEVFRVQSTLRTPVISLTDRKVILRHKTRVRRWPALGPLQTAALI
jgi:hypothetical protein